MRQSLATSRVAVLICVLCGSARSAELPGFEAMQTGPGTPGRWETVVDAEAADGRAVVQTSDDPTDDRFPLLIRMATAPADVRVRTRIKPMAGSVDQAGGMALRLLDRNNYYLVRANALESNVRFYKVTAGRRVQLAGADLPVTAGAWHELAITAREDRFAVSFDGRELFTAVDETFRSPGKIAFWTKADSVTWFDRLDVEELR
jgi:hypothetical protein|uniref:hypothetical protein n=1 Tax=Methylobacterium radiotolerans TaxID=31998 RepID=UPI002286EC7A|nr:hypothetical protein [Methylobacterium radiotolerans]WKV18917.1 LamG domain-containing protein [Methylobacterium radiotolerans JCM 2831]